MTNAPPLNHALTLLRDSIGGGAVTGNTKFTPVGHLHGDPGLGLGGHWHSPTGRLLELEIIVTGQGDWLGLHLPVGQMDLSGAGFVGLVCRSIAPQPEMIRPCLRSASAEGFADCFFERHILAHAEPATHLDALHIASQRSLPDHADWRELVLFMPRQSFIWHLHDLRLFLL